MNCAEFKAKMPSEGDKNPQLANHLKNCKGCQEWLKNQLNEPPSGVSAEHWQRLTNRLDLNDTPLNPKAEQTGTQSLSQTEQNNAKSASQTVQNNAQSASQAGSKQPKQQSAADAQEAKGLGGQQAKPLTGQNTKPQKTISSSFFNGMTYGLVFGAALVVGLAVVDIQTNAINKEKLISSGLLLKNSCFGKKQQDYKNACNALFKRKTKGLEFIDSDKGFNYVLLKLPF